MIARSPKNVRSSVRLDMEIWRPDYSTSKGEKGAMIGRLNAVTGNNEARRLLLAWLFDLLGKPSAMNAEVAITELSTKEMSEAQWYAVWHWIGFYKDENGEWLTRPEFPLEATLCLTEAMKDYQKIQPGTQQNREWVGDMLADAVGQLGGVITNVAAVTLGDDATIESWLPHENVEMPPDYPKKPTPVRKWTTDVDL